MMGDANEESPAANKPEGSVSNGDESTGEVIGSAAIRPVFLGNLMPNYSTARVTEMFERPFDLNLKKDFTPIPVDRIDVKRGYCFVFLQDAKSQEDKARIEEFVKEINGIEVPNISRAVRVEFARGDGRVKRKEDERRKKIAPSETLFVVNFHEETTKKEDLEMLFEPFGELVRIDMKRNYAFVQFRSIAEATRAKEATNGGKLDQSVLTVEYVARQRQGEGDRRDRRDRGYRRDDRPRDYDDRPRSFDDRYGRGGGGYDDRGRGGDRRHYDNRHLRRDSPPRRRSRSRSPRYGRSRSPPRRYDDRYDDYRRDRRSRSPPLRRGPSPRRSPSPEFYRGGDRDRGYRG